MVDDDYIMKLASKETCTGCNACAYVCPRKCIDFKDDKTYNIAYPVINENECINCGKCSKICPALNPIEGVVPLKAYAAWSSDTEERHTSASGGIAAEIYEYAIEMGWSIVGAAFCEEFKVCLELSNDKDAIKKFKNSKYVFSSTSDVFQKIAQKLKFGGKIIVIALPCQIAAIRKIFQKDLDDLLLVDLVCHGIMPYVYLKQYISYMEKSYQKKVKSLTFRDPKSGTQNYFLSLYDQEENCFYSSNKLKDSYQFAFHNMVAYRENCYHCYYANNRRISDITLGDYKGLGLCAPCTFSNKKVSCILVNTEKGKKYIDKLVENKLIVAENRPIEEPIKGDSQLRHPSLKSFSRRLWEKKYNGDFVNVIQYVYRISKYRDCLLWVCHLPKRIFRKILRILHIKNKYR